MTPRCFCAAASASGETRLFWCAKISQMFKRIFHPAGIKSFYAKYEGRIGALAILLGFIFDNLTFRDASIRAQTAVFVVYLVLAGLAILALHFLESREQGRESSSKHHFWSFIFLQFALGSLFSMYFVFYSRGVSIATSWPFLLLLAAIMISTEAWKSHYLRLSLQVAMLFVAIFSFCIYFLPVVLHRMNAAVFFSSGLLALALVLLFLRILVYISPKRVEAARGRIALGVLAVYASMNLLYFTNAIPPVPLVMKSGGVYHYFSRAIEGYSVFEEEKPWQEIFRAFPAYHRAFGEPVYAVSAVYAPARLETEITHNWQYYDEEAHRWRSATKIKVPIVGGREGGYRMYSVKYSIFPGLWRVDVETAEGQIVGRIRFKIVEDGAFPPMEEKIY